jgi:mono/diheme cytochrome c family protein
MLLNALIAAGLSTDQKLGLLAFGLAFIVFALICSFVLPSRNANFPGRGIVWFVVVTACFVVAMLAAVLTLGKESTEASTEPTTTAPASTAPAPTTTGGGAPAAKGDPTAGKAVFTSAGCSSCHTLKAAGSTGTVGPDLDQLKPAEDTVVHQVEVGGGPMPAFKDTLTAKQIQDVAAFVYVSTH